MPALLTCARCGEPDAEHAASLTDTVLELFEQSMQGSKEAIGNTVSFIFPTTSFKMGGRVSGYVQPAAIARVLTRNRDALGIPADNTYTPHDLRRTAATCMNQLGFRPHIVEHVVNHISGSRAGVAGTYNRSLPLDQMRTALEQWEHKLLSMIGEADSNNVVSING